jgi:SAM-dependent methyltransferase
MDFKPYDTRHYLTVPVRQGYGEWAETYDETVLDLMDIRLLDGLQTVAWARIERAADLACGTGRTGVWLKHAGVQEVHGVDVTAKMLDRARAKGVYDRLVLADLAATGLDGGRYDLVTEVLADEHLQDLDPLYREAARIVAPSGRFVIVGYHPHFLMMGIPTHYDRAPGQPVAIESHVHLFSSHVRAAHTASLRLVEMSEGLVDDAWIDAKPNWQAFRHHPVSFTMVWARAP